MANNQASVLVNKVKPHKDSWKVHVKLLHSRTQNTTYGGETLECVLADQTVRQNCLEIYSICFMRTILIFAIVVFLGRKNSRKLQKNSDVSSSTKSPAW